MKNAKGVVLLVGMMLVLSVVECKECTTSSKPHLSRCDMYFKCVVLPSQTIVWIPSKCDRGLIYEPGLKLCTLPAEDWECTLGDTNATQTTQDDRNVYGVNNLEYLQNQINNYRPLFHDSSVNTDSADSPKPMKPIDADGEEEEDTVLMISNDSSDGDNIEVVQDFSSPSTNGNEEDVEGSGYDADIDESIPQQKNNPIIMPLTHEYDGAVANQLQRLSQLIQSMSSAQQQHNQSETAELTPNDLNTFLANYNILSGFQPTVQPLSNAKKHQMSPDGKIPADRLVEILRLQQKIQHLSTKDDHYVKTVVPIRFHDKIEDIHHVNPTDQQTVKTVRVNGNGVSAAQIVVNRPEGSVLFSLPGGVAPIQPTSTTQQDNTHNYISQETLKAVLDLSKQMIASNVQQQQQQQQSYLQQTPIYRPVFYSVPVQDLPIHIISEHKGTSENNQNINSYNVDKTMEKVSSVKGHVDVTGDDRTTVIHNHIPITIENRKAIKPTSAPVVSEQQPVTETRYDSFGEKIISGQHNYQLSNNNPLYSPYPPYNDAQLQHQPSYGPVYTPNTYQPPSPPIYPPYNPYQPFDYSPYQQQQHLSQTPSTYQPQQLSQTPPQPPPKQQNFLPFPNQIYPTTPHLSELNINSYVNLNTPAYPTLHPTNAPAAAPTPPTATPSPPAPPQQMPQYMVNAQFTHPQNDIQYNTYNDQSGDEYNTISRYESDDKDDNLFNESYDHDLDSNENVIGELSPSENQSFDQRPNSDAASNLESKQTFESMLNQLKPVVSTGSHHKSGYDDASKNHKIVHYGSTYMTYKDYEQSVAPLLAKGGAQKVEVLSCVTGARQPNSQDCAKYFVCNAATQKVLDYVCPQFTAFNRESHFCDAKTYAECKAGPSVKPVITVDANRRIYEEAQQAKLQLEQAQRIRDEAYRDHLLTAQINQETEEFLQNKRKPVTVRPPKRRKGSQVTATTARPRRPLPPRKRLIKCNEPTKVRDSLSIYNYFTCFNGPDGKLKALKQTCPGGLIFCTHMKMCTSQDRC